MKKEDKGYT